MSTIRYITRTGCVAVALVSSLWAFASYAEQGQQQHMQGANFEQNEIGNQQNNNDMQDNNNLQQTATQSPTQDPLKQYPGSTRPSRTSSSR